jgi:hypothetical protein
MGVALRAGLLAELKPPGVFTRWAAIPDARGSRAKRERRAPPDPGPWIWMPLALYGRQGKLRRGLRFVQSGISAGLPATPLPALLFAASSSCSESLEPESDNKERVRDAQVNWKQRAEGAEGKGDLRCRTGALRVPNELAMTATPLLGFAVGRETQIAGQLRHLQILERVPSQLTEHSRAMTAELLRNDIDGHAGVTPELDLATLIQTNLGVGALHVPFIASNRRWILLQNRTLW